jgi:hypothetical protein
MINENLAVFSREFICDNGYERYEIFKDKEEVEKLELKLYNKVNKHLFLKDKETGEPLNVRLVQEDRSYNSNFITSMLRLNILITLHCGLKGLNWDNYHPRETDNSKVAVLPYLSYNYSKFQTVAFSVFKGDYSFMKPMPSNCYKALVFNLPELTSESQMEYFLAKVKDLARDLNFSVLELGLAVDEKFYDGEIGYDEDDEYFEEYYHDGTEFGNYLFTKYNKNASEVISTSGYGDDGFFSTFNFVL